MTEPTPRVWVGCLAAYNAGTLHGEWVDVEGMDAEDLYQAILDVLKSSPEPGAEEWGFFDHEDLPGIGEYSAVEDVIETAELVNKYPIALVTGVLANGIKLAELGEWLGDRSYGHYESRAEYAQEYHEGAPEHPLDGYIDWDAVGRDLLMDAIEIDAPDGGIYVVHY